MTDAIEILINEHRLIMKMLGALEAFTERMGEEPASDRDTIRDFAEFFSKYVDECHHGKEEGFLFIRMSAYGFSNEAGPVSAMLSEQGEGREHLVALTEVGRGSGPLGSREQKLVKGHALGYILRIESHMRREDDILFPVARHVLPPHVLEDLTRSFEEFDGNSENLPRNEMLHRTAHRLLAKYPPKRYLSSPPGGSSV